MTPDRAAFERALRSQWIQAQERGDDHVDIVSGELHRLVGGYPGPNHRMPVCCDVMCAAMGPGDEVLKAPPKGKGASLVIRYVLPRGQSWPSAADRSRDAKASVAAAPVDAGQPPGTSSATPRERKGRVGLVGCVKKKLARAAPAKDLYVSPLFRGRRAYVERNCERWLILSALHGVVLPEAQLEPYDVTLNDASGAERRAWALRVLQQLDAELGSCTGLTFEIHAGANCADFGLVDGLRERGAEVERPAAGLSMGQQLAYYAQAEAMSADVSSAAVADVPPAEEWASSEPSLAVGLAPPWEERDAWTAISDLDETPVLVRARDWPGDVACLDRPGLYAWWVDDSGAVDLAHGLGLTLAPGRIYAGQAGATKWPSGTRGDHTLGKRIGQMHLGGKVRMSTFRWTLAAILSQQLDVQVQASMLITPSSEQALTEWMREHLSVAVHPHDDRDTLEGLERELLRMFDPPLNLRHMRPTPLRARVTDLRRRISREP